MIDDALDLRTTVFDLLGSSYTADQWPRMVKMAERYLNRILRTHEQITSTTLTFVDGVATLPSDYVETIRLGSVHRPYREVFAGDYNAALSTCSFDYTIEGSTIKATGADGDVAFQYYAALPTLADDLTATNWLLQGHPDVYLNCILAKTHMNDIEKSATYERGLSMALAGMKTASNRANMGNSNVRINAV